MMMLSMYGPYDGQAYTYPACSPEDYQDDFFKEYLFGYGYNGMDADEVKQPFQCTDETTTGTDLDNFPFYQTVRCVTGKPESDVDIIDTPGMDTTTTSVEDNTTSSGSLESFEYDDDDASWEETESRDTDSTAMDTATETTASNPTEPAETSSSSSTSSSDSTSSGSGSSEWDWYPSGLRIYEKFN